MTSSVAGETAMPKTKQRPKPRRTQEERSTATRALLLDATIEALVELGYSDTTTTVIAERAGVSRGAQLHHYRTKAELVAAAIEHLANKLLVEFSAELADVPDTDRLDFSFDALWAAFSTPLFSAWMELTVASRTDDELRASLDPFETWLQNTILERIQTLFGDSVEVGSEEVVALGMTLCLFQGMSMARWSSAGQIRRVDGLESAMLETWKRMVRSTLSAVENP